MIRFRFKGAVALLTLCAIVAGVPVFLYGLGGGLPTQVPDAHAAGSFFGQPLSDSDVVRGLSLVCWAAWLLFLISLAAEIAARAQNRPSPSISRRGFRIPGLQGAAGSLFITAMLLLPQRPAASAVFASGATAGAAVQTVVSQSQPDNQVVPIDVQSTLPSTANLPYVVQHGDTLWGIAEAHTGNGLAWRQITDSGGRSFDTGVDDWVQVNGQMIYEREARTIFGGETVYLPASWVPIRSAAAVEPVKDPQAPPSASVSQKPVTLPTAATAQPPRVLAPTTTDSAPTSERTRVASDAKPASLAPVEAIALVGSGMVGGAVLSTLARRRSRQARFRPSGRRIPLPTGHLATVEEQIRNQGSIDLPARTHRALRSLDRYLEEVGGGAPRVCAVNAHDEFIEVLLDRPKPAPEGWSSVEGRSSWTIPADRVPTDIGTGRDPCPCLVPVGRALGSDGHLMVDLSVPGVVRVVGDRSRRSGFVHSVALAMAGLPWAESADVVVVGTGTPTMDYGVHIRTASTLEKLLDDLESRVIDLRDSTAGRQLEDRLPLAVLVEGDEPSDSLARLERLCSGEIGVSAMVTSSSPGAGWNLDLSANPVCLPQIGVEFEPLQPPEGWLADAEALLALASRDDSVSLQEPPYDRLESGMRPADIVMSAAAEGLSDVVAHDEPAAVSTAQINVLGHVTFNGVDDFLRPRSFEIALYLAFHPDGVSESRLDEAIWPAKSQVPNSTRDQAVSAARIALGGRTRFPLAQGQGANKTYRLSDLVTTDWSEFCNLHRIGRQDGVADSLCDALRLVRGRPFGDLDAGPGFQWLHTEGHVHHMQAEIADVADLAAGLLLDANQPHEARWAANQGLLAGPYTERLWVRLMAAADALGEGQEVERLLAEMDTRLGLEGDYSQLHPDTIAAYRLYSRQRSSLRP